MNPQEIVFYILSSLTILCAAGVIFSRSPINSIVVQVSAVLSGGILLTVIIAAFKTYSIQLTTGHALNGQTDIGLIKNLGVILFKEYALPFEISSVLF